MLAKDCRRLTLLILPALLIIYTASCFYRDTLVPQDSPDGARTREQIDDPLSSPLDPALSLQPLHPHNAEILAVHTEAAHLGSPATTQEEDPASPIAHDDHASGTAWKKGNHREVFSASTTDQRYFLIDFGEVKAMNPNVIPHPHFEEFWIVVAQEAREPDVQDPEFREIACNAAFRNGALRCIFPPVKLPIARTVGNKCTGELSFFGLNAGPHDARVLYGPEKPYILYGSNSGFTCFGQWLHDFRELRGDWIERPGNSDFRIATELQRPAPFSAVEKNWFPFWDASGQMYVHYDIAPRRVFAKVAADGSAGEDLAPLAAASDFRCLSRYLPDLPGELESIHQATNSLRVTMCRRADPTCIPSAFNTFLFTIWQHKSFYHFHGVYEPYVMLFQQEAPFAMHAMSREPIWIHGRREHPERGTSDMFYVTSVNWKEKGVGYHGFLDDELIVGFGIEDQGSGGIDLVASELLAGLGLCLGS